MEVVLMGYLPDAEGIMAACAESCNTSSPAHKLYQSMDDERARGVIKYIQEHGHLSVEEFSSYVFSISGLSRVATHQLVRHRMATFLQQSMRYSEPSDFELIDGKYVPWFVIPPNMVRAAEESEDGLGDLMSYFELAGVSKRTYGGMLGKKEDKRFSILHGVKTNISMIANGREFRETIIPLRTCYTAQWEIRSMAYAISTLLRSVSPTLFEEVGPKCITDKCIERYSGRCEQIVRNILDELKRLESGIEVGKYLDLTDVIGYRADSELEERLAEELELEHPVNLSFEVKIMRMK